MALTDIILRVISKAGFVTKGSELTWIEHDNNWAALIDAVQALNSTGNIAPYNPAQAYPLNNTGGSPVTTYVSYNGNVYLFIGTPYQTGVTPGVNPSVWQLVSTGALAHQQNTDTYLDIAGANAISASEIVTYLRNHILSMTRATLILARDNGFLKPGYFYHVTDSNVWMQANGSGTFYPNSFDVNAGYLRPCYYDLDADTKVFLTNKSIAYYDSADGKWKDTGLQYTGSNTWTATTGNKTLFSTNWSVLSQGSGSSYDVLVSVAGGSGFGVLASSPSGSLYNKTQLAFRDLWEMLVQDPTTGVLKSKIIVSEEGLEITGNEASTTPICGLATLVSGVATINTNKILSATTRVILSRQGKNSSTAIGELSIANIVNGTSFDIVALNSSAATATGDLSDVYWMIVSKTP